MATLHAKSPCCRGAIYRFGNRRRQCSICKRTWSVRKKRRGRKRRRIALKLLNCILLERHTIVQEQKRLLLSASGLACRYGKAMEAIASKPYPLHRLPSGPYALVADGLYFKFNRMDWVMYVMAVKPTTDTAAHFLDPVLLAGRECYERWVEAIDTMPPSVRSHVQAFVSDGFRGSQRLALQRRWIHQRCHFHLLAALVRGKGRRQYRLRSSDLRATLLEHTRALLAATSSTMMKRALVDQPACPSYLRKQTLEFLERECDFRSYLRYPHLNLPTTTNAIESAGRMIRRATRTARTPQSLLLRATVFLRLQRTILCNGKIQQN